MTGIDATSRHVGASAWQAAGPGFEVYDTECEAVLGGAARLALVTETDAHEGPVYVPGEDALYFTSLPRKVDIPATGTPGAYIKRLALDGLNFPVDPSRLSVVPARVNMPNGMALGRDGRLVVCEQGTRAEYARISRVDPTTGEAETVVDAWGGLRLNSPNDVAVKGDGTIWFTDPSYGFLQGFRPEPQAGDYVYRYGPGSDRLSVVADGFDKPNGLAFSLTSGPSISPTAAPTRNRAATTSGGRTTSSPSTFMTAVTLGLAACSRSRLPGSRTESRQTARAASMRLRPAASRCSARPVTSSA